MPLLSRDDGALSDRTPSRTRLCEERVEVSSSPSPPVVMTWHDVKYKIQTDCGTGSFNEGERTILHGISGFARSGELLAILGPPGSGKTTLLRALAQRATPAGRVTGDIRLSPCIPPDRGVFCRVTSYVPQRPDPAPALLTLEETVLFAAQLRTPPTVTTDQVRSRVRHTLALLGVDQERYCLVGKGELREPGGCEMKRCALAVELVTSPLVLFLDEPTAGLDTVRAVHLMMVLRTLARDGMAVVVTLDRPRGSVFQMLDRVLLLNGVGEEAFFGSATDAVRFLQELGVATPAHDAANPADALVDSVTVTRSGEQHRLLSTLRDYYTAEARNAAAAHSRPTATDGCEEDEGRWDAVRPTLTPLVLLPPLEIAAPTQGRDIAAAFRATRLAPLEAEIERISRANACVADGGSALTPACGPYQRSFFTQWHALLSRRFLRRRRDVLPALATMTVMAVLALSVGSAYYQLGYSQASIRDRVGVLFLVVVLLTFSWLWQLRVWTPQHTVCARESRRGMYGPTAYFAALVSVDVLWCAVVSTIFSGTVFSLVGLPAATDWWRFLLADTSCLLVMLNAYGVCLIVSIVVRNSTAGTVVAALWFVLQLLPTRDVLISADSLPWGWRGLPYVSFVANGFAVLVVNTFTGLQFACDSGNTTSSQSGVDAEAVPCFASGEAYMASVGFHSKDEEAGLKRLGYGALLCSALAYIALRCCWRTQRYR